MLGAGASSDRRPLPTALTSYKQRVFDHRRQPTSGRVTVDHPPWVAGARGLDPEPCDYGWISYPQCPRGGALGWSTLRGAVSPGDRITVVIALADLNDAQRDTVVLLDHWRWTCDACVADACGLAPAT